MTSRPVAAPSARKNAVASYDEATGRYALTHEGVRVFAVKTDALVAVLAPFGLREGTARTMVTAYLKVMADDDYNPGPAAKILNAYNIALGPHPGEGGSGQRATLCLAW